MKKTFKKIAAFVTFPTSIMVLFEIHQMFKGHFFNELSNTWSSIHEKVKKHWSWVEKKRCLYRSSHRRCFLRKGVLRNFTNFTGKHPCQSLFIKKESLAQVLSCEFCEISKNTFFTEHLWTTASPIKKISVYEDC